MSKDGRVKVFHRTVDKAYQQWYLYPSNQVCKGTSQEVQVERCKRNKDSYASNMSWTE